MATGYRAARDEEKAELDRERVRLWYVAATRARELLVLPRLDVDAAASAWSSAVDLALPGLPALELDDLANEVGAAEPETENRQTRAVFADEASGIAERTRAIVWRAPSRDEGTTLPEPRDEVPTILATDGDGAPADGPAVAAVQGGRERGTILHKLIEEVLTGETVEEETVLVARAETLIRDLGLPVMDDPAQGLAPPELTACVLRALALDLLSRVRGDHGVAITPALERALSAGCACAHRTRSAAPRFRPSSPSYRGRPDAAPQPGYDLKAVLRGQECSEDLFAVVTG